MIVEDRYVKDYYIIISESRTKDTEEYEITKHLPLLANSNDYYFLHNQFHLQDKTYTKISNTLLANSTNLGVISSLSPSKNRLSQAEIL